MLIWVWGLDLKEGREFCSPWGRTGATVRCSRIFWPVVIYGGISEEDQQAESYCNLDGMWQGCERRQGRYGEWGRGRVVWYCRGVSCILKRYMDYSILKTSLFCWCLTSFHTQSDTWFKITLLTEELRLRLPQMKLFSANTSCLLVYLLSKWHHQSFLMEF